MSALQAISLVLVILVAAANLGMAGLFLFDLPNGMTTGAMALVWLALLSALAVLAFLGWQLRRAGRPGLACLLLVVGPVAAFVCFILMLFAVHPYGHH